VRCQGRVGKSILYPSKKISTGQKGRVFIYQSGRSQGLEKQVSPVLSFLLPASNFFSHPVGVKDDPPIRLVSPLVSFLLKASRVSLYLFRCSFPSVPPPNLLPSRRSLFLRTGDNELLDTACLLARTREARTRYART
jgi:hypothetical protein